MDCLLRNGYLRTKQTAGCKYAILGKYLVIFFHCPKMDIPYKRTGMVTHLVNRYYCFSKSLILLLA